MKFTTILFSLAIIATTNNNGVHCMDDMDDMDNTTDTSASASASFDEERYGNGGSGYDFCGILKESFGGIKTGSRCIKDFEKMMNTEKNSALTEAWADWTISLQADEGLSTEGGNSSYSYTSSYSDDTTAIFKEECEKVEGTTFTQIPDRSFQCRVEGESTKTATVAVTNNAFCLPASKNCDTTMTDLKLTATDFANVYLYNMLVNYWPEVDCNTMKMDTYDSGGAVTSTKFIGSLVAGTAVIAFIVLI